jgi:hypothetical protein
MFPSWLFPSHFSQNREVRIGRVQNLQQMDGHQWAFSKHTITSTAISTYFRERISQLTILSVIQPNCWVAFQFAAQVMSRGICGGQSGTGAGFLRVLRFPLPILIPLTALHSSSSSSAAGTIGQLVTDVRSGLSLTPPQETKNLFNHQAI